MTENRSALVVAVSEYQDAGLRRLVAPAQDAEALARVLRDPDIGNFAVKTLLNQPSHQINREIEAFFANRTKEDLLLLYFSGHGLKDDAGRLYFASPDTDRKLLRATAIAATLLHEVMNSCRSRSKVLILDCCHSGAFARGMTHRTDETVGTGEYFSGGRGQFVLTASDAIQYAFEGDAVSGEGVCSVFTDTLVRGLETGEADLDGDGTISCDELYDYLYGRIMDRMPQQQPRKWAFDVEGDIMIAHNPHPVAKLTALPVELRDSSEDPRPWVREGAAGRLGDLLQHSNKSIAVAAQVMLQRMVEDDSLRVRTVAVGILKAHNGQVLLATGQAISETPITKNVENPSKIEKACDTESAHTGDAPPTPTTIFLGRNPAPPSNKPVALLIPLAILKKFLIVFVLGVLSYTGLYYLMETIEAAREEMARKEAARKEAAREEAAKKAREEAAKKAREEAAREEAAREEAAKKAREEAAARERTVKNLQRKVARTLKMEVEFQDTLKGGGQGPIMVVIPGGSFLMGSPQNELDRKNNERQHEIKVDTFALGKYEVTFEEYDRFAKATGRRNPPDEGWGRGRHPVINVTWFDAVAYADWLSQQTGQPYRLPTETEWEYAARAGTTTPFYFGDTITTSQANYNGKKPIEVGKFSPNSWGLHDMHGNVSEWTCSAYDASYQGGEKWCVCEDNDACRRMLRGGAWLNNLYWLRSAVRAMDFPAKKDNSRGFRLAMIF